MQHFQLRKIILTKWIWVTWEKILNTKSNPQPSRGQHGYINVRIDLQVSRFSLNKKISIPCTVNSYSTPNVSWKFNGRLVRSGPRIQVNTFIIILLEIKPCGLGPKIWDVEALYHWHKPNLPHKWPLLQVCYRS